MSNWPNLATPGISWPNEGSQTPGVPPPSSSAFKFYCMREGTTPDYQNYLWEAPEKIDRWNDTDVLQFSVVPIDDSFVRLRRGDYIKVETALYGLWFTGYITNEPDYQPIGKDCKTGQYVWGYRYSASSDDHILTLQQLGTISTYYNTTQGAILKDIINRKAPNVFDVNGISAGLTVARYEIDPTKKFHDVLKDFAAASGYRWWAKDKQLSYVPVTTVTPPVTIDYNDQYFTPSKLSIASTKDQPISNDVIVIGGREPQGWVNEYFVSDGYEGKHQLLCTPDGIDSSIIIDEQFSSLDETKWAVVDPNSMYFQVDQNFLNVLGGNASGRLDIAISALPTIPLQGQLRLTHGEFQFVNSGSNGVSGVIGGLWTGTPTMSNMNTFPGCVYGIRSYHFGSLTTIAPIVAGAADLLQYVTVDFTKRYIIRTLVSVVQSNRLVTEYAARDSGGTYQSFGGETYSGDTQFTTYVTEINPTDGTVTNRWTWINYTTLDPNNGTAIYVLAASNDLHCTVSNVTISLPMQFFLEVADWDAGTKTWKSWTPKLVGPNDIDAMDGLAPAATVTMSSKSSAQANASKLNDSQATLEFFKNSTSLTSTIPAARSKIHVQYRRSGPAVARVRSASSIGTEATLWGDTGLRTYVKSDVKPTPMTSAECEAAAAALLTDYGYQHYEGSYEIPSTICTGGEPVSGTLLPFANMPVSVFPYLTAELVVEVRSKLVTRSVSPVGGECYIHTIRFGRPDSLTKLVQGWQNNTPQDNVTTDASTVPNWIDLGDVGTSYLEDALIPVLSSMNATTFTIDMGSTPPAGGGYEVRYTDSGWGVNDGTNLVQRVTTQTFQIPRTTRGHIVFVRAYDADGVYSRYSAGVRISYPFVPPILYDVDFYLSDIVNPELALLLPLSLSDVWGVEIRAADDTTVLYSADLADVSGALTFVWYRHAGNTTRSLDYKCYTYNLLNEYSPTYHATWSLPIPSASGLSLDGQNLRLSWSGLNATKYNVVISSDSSGVPTTFNKTVTSEFVDLTDSDFMQQRWIWVYPCDDLGPGTPVTMSHVYTAAGVVAFDNVAYVESVKLPVSSTTDPTYTDDWLDTAWEMRQKSWLYWAANRRLIDS